MSGRRAFLYAAALFAAAGMSSARSIRLAGHVQVSLVAGADGALKDVRVISGHPLLIKGALEIVKTWRFAPGTIDGKPAEMETHATLAVATARDLLLSASGVLPAYPADATGVVHARAVVAQDGLVTSVEIVDGPELLRQASADAIKRWRYEPSSTPGSTSVPVEFAFRSLQESMEVYVISVGALIPPGLPLPRPKPGVVLPRIQ